MYEYILVRLIINPYIFIYAVFLNRAECKYTRDIPAVILNFYFPTTEIIYYVVIPNSMSFYFHYILTGSSPNTSVTHI